MISMTTYWQQFKECIDILQTSTKDKSYSSLITIAETLIKIGLTIETLGITEIKKVSNQLHEKVKLFGNEILYTEDKEYTFYLPKIESTQSLVFATLYYQHLTHYQQVSYQGTINWFRQMVIDGVNEKKITTAIQAKALLQEIRAYCKKKKITVEESLFLKSPKESIKEYTSRVLTLFNKCEEPIKEETKEPSQPDPITELEQSLKILEYRIRGLTKKTESIVQKLLTYTQAKKNHSKLACKWENKWFITRAFYRFISIFYEVPEIKNLKKAEKELIQAENELNGELPHHTSESYLEKLHKLQQRLTSDHKKIEHIVSIKKKEIHQTKEEDKTISTVKPHVVHNSGKAVIQSDLDKQTSPTLMQSQSNHDYYGFFKEYLPSRYTLQAIAVGAAAIIIQNL